MYTIVVNHKPLPPYTVKKWDEEVICCERHKDEFVKLCVDFHATFSVGMCVENKECFRCVRESGAVARKL